MAHERILEVFDGRLQPVSADSPLMLSTDSPWPGFVFERDICRPGSADTLLYPHTCLVFVDSGHVDVEDCALKRHPRFVSRRGSVTLWPAGHEARSIRWMPASRTEMVRVQLNPAVLARLSADDDRFLRRPLDHQPGVVDEAVASLVRLMVAEVAAGCPSGRIYAESLCMALAARVAEQFAGGSREVLRAPGGLSRRQLDRVRDHVEANISCDLSLADLAAVIGLSARHFTTAFRRSMGTSPHQYVLRRRVEAAKSALAGTRLPMAEVSAMVGFSSQSHFTDVFRRMVGTTPRQFRRGG